MSMDPASIVGIIGSVVGIADVVGTSIRRLNSLRLKYREVPFRISSLIGQLYTIQVAVDHLSLWTQQDLTSDSRFIDLAFQVSNSLDNIGPLVMYLNEDLNKLEALKEGEMSSSKKISFLWSEKDLAEYTVLLNNQVNALTLLLQAVQWYVLSIEPPNVC